MEKDIGYNFLKSIHLCFIDIQFFYQIQTFGFDKENKKWSQIKTSDKKLSTLNACFVSCIFF